ncbi:TetR/AcrR family transcriptional regulator [Occultella glacieicola]|uniref:TetR/AcrR family transcriptional regulator n=1 Tax=Occultella glacieicola TaxID=2518684 RepID=A0ABY2EAS4_9MICO|nr:helix-turn-helix domain-containing protein [Occultella glacieicola]TDE99040.1 TetR/AcrR family transcriptional regulator [Occultella glacieicola]
MASLPRSRREQQQQTRDALVVAARQAFAEHGYHAANLEAIAREAGFSKGAVYSNFDGKADLFLAVIDANVEIAFADGGWNITTDDPIEAEHGEGLSAAIEGFALATLEFIATAARDSRLSAEMGKRMDLLVDGYGAVATQSGSADDVLPTAELGALLAALDQGAALLSLGGSRAIDQRVLRTGMRRILTAGPLEDTPGGRGEPAVHDAAVRQRIRASIMTQDVSPTAESYG